MSLGNELLSELEGEVEVRSDDHGAYLNATEKCHEFCCSKVSLLLSRYPMKIWIPQINPARRSGCTWLFGVQFGGGLVEGDNVRCKITVQANCCVLYASLGQNKAYQCAVGKTVCQKNDFHVGPNSALFVLPDPTLLQKESALSQYQVTRVASNGNLVLLDWYISGREGLLEHWEGASLRSVNSIHMDGVEIFRDVMCLSGDLTLRRASMGKYRVIGLCVVVGDVVGRHLADAIKALSIGNSYGVAADTNQIVACSPLYSDCSDTVVCGHVIRFCYSTTITAYEGVADILNPIFAMAGGNPFEKNY
ncbi:putative Urease accessory protein D [Hypsibius exemplaris]|uniref:Urease accessory protein D n=1 Tax=Hypsibius exemplaris TaxID=2072580 RepID=A0A1W0XAE0_HYPEX|nr:putative Urease accessory protein D [Hypsibius exemplaris]